MRIQTKQDCEQQNRRWRLLNQDHDNLKAEKAAMAAQLTTARQWADRWRARALKVEAANKRLWAENQRLLDKLTDMREDECDCDRPDSGAARRSDAVVEPTGRPAEGGVRGDAGGAVPPA